MHAADKHKACSREQELLDQADEGLLSVAGSKLTEHEDSHDRDREHEVNCDELKENTPSMANSKPLVPEESVAVKRVTCRKVSQVCLSNTCVFICFLYRENEHVTERNKNPKRSHNVRTSLSLRSVPLHHVTSVALFHTHHCHQLVMAVASYLVQRHQLVTAVTFFLTYHRHWLVLAVTSFLMYRYAITVNFIPA